MKFHNAASVSILIFILSLFSCKSANINPSPSTRPTLRMVFAGDIMCHKENADTPFDRIYSEIEGDLQVADLCFANFECPVIPSRDYSFYPTFSTKPEYAQAAIDAGFNVFSLANNHINDFRAEGIVETKKWFDSVEDIYTNGIKEVPGSQIEFTLMEKNGFRILFAAVTEVLNFKTQTDMFNVIQGTEEARSEFLSLIKSRKEQSGCNLLVIGFHTAEEEYELSIDETSKKFYHDMMEAGTDILWINHPHVSKNWEAMMDSRGQCRGMIFYSVGNTISGQRRKYNFANPALPREYTGDSFLFTVNATMEPDGTVSFTIEPQLITTCITENNWFVIKKFNDGFIQSLKNQGRTKEAQYFSERKKLMEKIIGIEKWQ